MRRTYDTKEYAENIEMARSYFPDANFGADVIPGFPGETDEEFIETMNFIEKTGLNYLHVFPLLEETKYCSRSYAWPSSTSTC